MTSTFQLEGGSGVGSTSYSAAAGPRPRACLAKTTCLGLPRSPGGKYIARKSFMLKVSVGLSQKDSTNGSRKTT